MENCFYCTEKLSEKNRVCCAICYKWFHWKCAKIELFERKFIEFFHCTDCSVENGVSQG